MSKMKILHVSEAFGWSGGAAQCVFLADYLRKKGYENIIACPEGGDLHKRSLSENIRTYDFSPKNKTDLKASLALAAFLEKENISVIHAHHPKAHNASLLAKFFSKNKPALIVSRRVSHILPNNFLARLKYKTKLVDAYIPVCDYVKKMLIDYGIEEERIFTVYSGTDKNKYRKFPRDIIFKKDLGLNEEDFVISLIGNYSKDKGQHIFIEALNILKGKGYRFKALFAGKNTDCEELKRIFASKIKEDIGLFLGLRSDVEKILNITDINVNAAVKGEALSGSLREAMACGVPSVAADIAGNSEILKDGENGFLFKPGDFKGLSDKLETLIKNEELRLKMSKAALSSFEEKFTVERMGEETLKVYLKFVS